MGRKAGAARDPVLVDDAQRPEAFMGRVVVIAEGEAVPGLQPAMIALAAFVGPANGNHGGTFGVVAACI
jgi:hypothetical protein